MTAVQRLRRAGEYQRALQRLVELLQADTFGPDELVALDEATRAAAQLLADSHAPDPQLTPPPSEVAPDPQLTPPPSEVAPVADGAGFGKRCAMCHTAKPRSAFSRSARSSDGLQLWCKDCQRERKQPRAQDGDAQPVAADPPAPRLTPIADTPAGKTCPRCETFKTRRHYPVNGDTADGLEVVCRPCRNAALKAAVGATDAAITQSMGDPPSRRRVRIVITCPTHGELNTDHHPEPANKDAWTASLVRVQSTLHDGCDEALAGHWHYVDDEAVPGSAVQHMRAAS